MVGGSDFNARPFNLATNGHRQPGSAFKPFILVRALEDGIDPNSTWASQPKTFSFVNGRGQKGSFPVANYEDSYLGTASLWSATATSDNSVFAELGMKVKPRRVARWRRTWGSEPSSPPTRRCSSEASRRASRRSRWPTPTRRSPTTASASQAGSPPTRPGRWRSRASRTATGRSRERGSRSACSRRRSARWQRTCSGSWSAAARARPPRSATSSSGARPAPPRTTATPGSWAATRT